MNRSEMKTEQKLWEPEEGDTYAAFSFDGNVIKDAYQDDILDKMVIKFGNLMAPDLAVKLAPIRAARNIIELWAVQLGCVSPINSYNLFYYVGFDNGLSIEHEYGNLHTPGVYYFPTREQAETLLEKCRPQFEILMKGI